MDGLLRCSRYAFGPNRLHYCGPDANSEIRAYIEAESEDPGLNALLRQFETLFPYLNHIARANGIRDPFDSRVVEAYWLGNDLLRAVNPREFHRLLRDDHRLKDKLGQKEFDRVEEKIGGGALPHHSFHVLNLWRTADARDIPRTLSDLDECRIGWGKVTDVAGPVVTVETEPLVLDRNRLALGQPVSRRLTRRLEAEYDIEQMRTGDWVSIHWGVPCEVLNPTQLRALRTYTGLNLDFANQTL